MKNYFILIFALSFYIGTFSQTEKQKINKADLLDKTHWLSVLPFQTGHFVCDVELND